MKRQIYDLTDEPFVMFVNRIGSVLRDENIPYNIGGGVAVQAYLLDFLCKMYREDITGLSHDPQLRIQDYIRSTDDVDVALKIEEDGKELEEEQKIKRIISILPKLAFEEISPSVQNVYEFRTARSGASRPTYRVYTDDEGSEEEVIAINFFRGQVGSLRGIDEKWYNHFIDNSYDIRLSYNDRSEVVVTVPKLEHLLAMKINNSRAKDLMDNKNLADLLTSQGVELNFDEIERIIPPESIDNYNHFLKCHYPKRLAESD